MRWFHGDAEMSEDNCQESSIRVAETLAGRTNHSLFETDALRRYATRVAINSAIGMLRRQARHQRKVLYARLGVDDMIASPQSQESGLDVGYLSEALQSLRDADRRAIELSLEGHSIREISRVMGVSYGAMAVRLHRIRAQLRTRLLIEGASQK